MSHFPSGRALALGAVLASLAVPSSAAAQAPPQKKEARELVRQGGGGRFRRPEEAPRHSGARRLQQDQLLHRQGHAARSHLRGVQALRGRSQQEVQDRQSQDSRRLHSDGPRGPRRRPALGARGHCGREPDDHSRASEDRGFLEPDDLQRLRDRRRGAGLGSHRGRRRPLRQGGVRPREVHLPREPAGVERRSRQARQTSGEAPVRAAGARGRGSAGDDERGTRQVRRRGGFPRPVLGRRLPEARAASRRPSCARTLRSAGRFERTARS